MLRPVALLLAGALVVLLGGVADAEEIDVEAEAEVEDDDVQAEVEASIDRTPLGVYVMEHGFLSADSPTWHPRGTLSLSSVQGRGGGGYEARLSDAKEFVDLRPELPSLMSNAVGTNSYYAVRMYNPEKPKRVLQAAVPASLLADSFEDWHDILEVAVSASGVPVGLSYRVRHTLGLSLFDHTQVHLSEPGRSEGPQVKPRQNTGGGVGGGAVGVDGEKVEEQQGGQSLLRKYWWVILIVMLLLSSAGDNGSDAGGKGGKGGGGGGAAPRRS